MFDLTKIENCILWSAILILIAYFGWWYRRFDVKKPPEENFEASGFELAPQLFPIIGILATFIGVAYGFLGFNPDDIEGSIPSLITGLSGAFIASAVGIVLLILASVRVSRYSSKYNYQKKSAETLALEKVVEAITVLSSQSNDQSKFLAELVDYTKAQNNFWKEERTRNTDFQSIILETVDKGFEDNLLETVAVTSEMRALRKEMSAPGMELIEKMLKQMEAGMEGMIKGMQALFSDRLKNEMETLADIVRENVAALKVLPAKIELMADAIPTAMKQINIQSDLLAQSLANMQAAQEGLREKQEQANEQNIEVVRQTQESLSTLRGFAEDVEQLGAQFLSVQKQQKDAGAHMEQMVAHIQEAINRNADSQKTLQGVTSNSINEQKAILQALQDSVRVVVALPSDLVDQFKVVNQDLEGIFSQIDKGLIAYQDTIQGSMGSYLDRYSGALNGAVNSLESSLEKQSENIEELEHTMKALSVELKKQ